MEQIVAAVISAFASIIVAIITVYGARKHFEGEKKSASHTVTPSQVHFRANMASLATNNFRIWGIICALTLVWILLAPKLIHGVLVGPTWLLIVPAITLLASFVWPIKAGLAMMFVFFLHAVNMLMSAFFREIWEKDVGTYTIVVLVSIIAINGILVSLIGSLRLSRSRINKMDTHH